jgi:cyanoexosortase A
LISLNSGDIGKISSTYFFYQKFKKTLKLQLKQIKYFLNHKSFWLLSTLSCLAVFHLYFIFKISGRSPLVNDYLHWTIILILLWGKRNKIKFRTNLIASLTGLLLTFWMVFRHLSVQIYTITSKVDIISGLFPLTVLTGILLVIAGFKRLINYKSEILISFVFTICSLPTLTSLANSSLIISLDAKLTAFLLHYIGFEVSRQGAIVNLTKGAIEIFPGCSSISLILLLIPVMFAIVLEYSTTIKRKILFCVGAIFCVFVVNSVRLTLLAILVDKSDLVNFEYWHKGSGVSLFSNIIVFLIAGIAYFILHYSSDSQQIKAED